MPGTCGNCKHIGVKRAEEPCNTCCNKAQNPGVQFSLWEAVDEEEEKKEVVCKPDKSSVAEDVRDMKVEQAWEIFKRFDRLGELKKKKRKEK